MTRLGPVVEFEFGSMAASFRVADHPASRASATIQEMNEVIASSERVRNAMRSQRTRNTLPELLLRQAMHRRGLRYRLHQRPIPSLRRTVDVVFRSARVAVEVRGCFWHACEIHGTWPKSNAEWWTRKLTGNRFRDEQLAGVLLSAGWDLIVVWDDDPDVAADQIARRVAERRAE